MLQAAAENIELRERLNGGPSANKAASAAVATYQQNQAQAGLPSEGQQILSGQSVSDNEPVFEQ